MLPAPATISVAEQPGTTTRTARLASSPGESTLRSGGHRFGGPHYLFEGGRLAKGALVRRSTALVHAPGEPAEEETEHEHGDEGDDSDQRFNCHAITSPYARSVAGRIGPELALGTLDPWTSAARQARASRMSASVTASGATAMWRVPRSKNLLDGPPSSPRFGSRVPVGVREKKVGARHAIPADGTRDALRKVGERERWDFPRELSTQCFVRYEVRHRVL